MMKTRNTLKHVKPYIPEKRFVMILTLVGFVERLDVPMTRRRVDQNEKN